MMWPESRHGRGDSPGVEAGLPAVMPLPPMRVMIRVFAGERIAAGIGMNVHDIPVHLQPYYRDLGFQEGDFPNAERYYRRAITLPLHPGLTHAQQDRVVAALGEAIA